MIRQGTYWVCLALVLTLAMPGSLLGAGTPAGTVITNQATVSFRMAGDAAMTTIASNVVSITVAQVAAVTIAPASAAQSTRINTVVDYPFLLVNIGNGPDRCTFRSVSSVGLTGQIYRDLDGDGVLSTADLNGGPVDGTIVLRADSSSSFILRIVVPDDPALVGQIDAMVLTATSQFDPSKRATISRSTLITAPMLTVRKSVSNSSPRGGDRVTYTLTVANTGNAEATSVTITDILDLRLRYVPGSATPVPDSVAGQMLRWTLLAVPAGSSAAIAFQVDVVSNAPAGTEIHNVALAGYFDGVNRRSVTSTELGFITIQSSGLVTVDISPNRAGAGEPGDTVAYGFVITNLGPLPETFDLGSTSTAGQVWTFFNDSTTHPRGTPVTSTGSLPGGSRFSLVARTILPVVSMDQTADYTSFRVQSVTNPGNIASATGTTLINVPVMVLTKTATAPDPRSGAEITYAITYVNEGHGTAYGFSITDMIPANTAYVAGSMTLNGTPKTDLQDGDEASMDSRSISISVGTVAPNGYGVVTFRVRIL